MQQCRISYMLPVVEQQNLPIRPDASKHTNAETGGFGDIPPESSCGRAEYIQKLPCYACLRRGTRRLSPYWCAGIIRIPLVICWKISLIAVSMG